MKLTLARPKHAKHISHFYRRVHDESFAHQELFSTETVEELLQDEELAIVIATHERSVLGCGLAFISPWNEALEIAAISVGDSARGGDVGKALFEAVRRLGLKNYGVVYFRASAKSGFRRGRQLGAFFWGYRPAPGSHSIDDAELLLGFPHRESHKKRVVPPVNQITKTTFASRIIDKIDGSQQGVPYPQSFPVGCPRGTGAPVISGRIWPTYHSRGNYIHIENAAGSHPVEIIKEFQNKVHNKGVRDIRLTIPVNQDRAIVALMKHGFRPVAYLPGWYLRGAHRFDCLKMVAGTPSIPASTQSFVERAVKRIDDELSIG